DHFALEVEGRAAGIAAVDRRVDLQEVAIGRAADVAALGGDDALGHRAAESEGIADRHHPVADARRGVGELDEGLVGEAVDLEHGQICALVGADDLGGLLRAVVENDRHLVGVLYDVVVGDEVAVGRNGKAGTGGFVMLDLLGGRRAELLEEVIKRTVGGQVLEAAAATVAIASVIAIIVTVISVVAAAIVAAGRLVGVAVRAHIDGD